MKFSEHWLREWVNPDVNIEELAEQLSLAGLEVDSVKPVVEPFANVFVGQILHVEKHPNADRLSVCTVDVGAKETFNIVCGAKNVRAGLKVVVATDGAVLPGGFKIKKSKLRGVESAGMICSASELELGVESEGIMELSGDAPVGSDFYSYYKLDDNVIEIELTANRGDCLSISGIAREVAALTRSKLNLPNFKKVKPKISDVIEVEIEAPARCPNYLCRVVRDISQSANTPLWMVQKLQRSGLNPISPLVDITNYVMVELGQPLHVFDLDKISDKIIVRNAKPKESLELLNGQVAELGEETLLITDKENPLALAGIMGGESSAVDEKTTNILFESAFFSPEKLLGEARKYGLHTDSSHRFERGVDPGLQKMAIERATQLLLEVVGGEPGPITQVLHDEYIPVKDKIELRFARIGNILGKEIPRLEVEDILERLAMEAKKTDDGWIVTAPSFRFDLSSEIDLIEEVARINGYDRIPNKRICAPLVARTGIHKRKMVQAAYSLMVERGYHEIISYSFVDPQLQKLLDPENEPLPLINPISKEFSVMRTSMWPGLLKAVQYNQARQQERIRLFEIGQCFIKNGGGLQQVARIGGLIMGDLYPQQWGVAKKHVDFFDLKGDVESLFSVNGDLNRTKIVVAKNPALHPGESAKILFDEKEVGFFGKLHPHIKDKLNIKNDVYLFDLNLTFIYNRRVFEYKEVSKFPQIRRDLAVVVKREVAFQDLLEGIREVKIGMLQRIELFDVYQGKGMDSDKKSMALRLIFQDNERTLTEADAEKMVEKFLINLKQKFNAELRG